MAAPQLTAATAAAQALVEPATAAAAAPVTKATAVGGTSGAAAAQAAQAAATALAAVALETATEVAAAAMVAAILLVAPTSRAWAAVWVVKEDGTRTSARVVSGRPKEVRCHCCFLHYMVVPGADSVLLCPSRGLSTACGQ